MNKSFLFKNVSTNGLCNVFASKVAEKDKLLIYMIVHENPDWDDYDQTSEEIQKAIDSPNMMIIHCVVADKNGDCFDANGYIYDDYLENINDTDDDFYLKLAHCMSNQCSHGDLDDEDPFDILCFTSKELQSEIENNPEKYDMNITSNVLEKNDIPEYYKWIENFKPQE